MSRYIFINRYFYPDHSATSQILSDLTFDLAAKGEDVHVITGNRTYDALDQTLPAEQRFNDVNVHRVAMSNFGRSKLGGRTVDYLSFYQNVYRRASALVRPGDVLIAKTDPPLLSVMAARIARKKHAHLVNWLQDLYPEVAMVLGVPLVRGRIANVLTKMRNRSLLAADANIVLGRCMAERLHGLGIRNIHTIPNWTEDERIQPLKGLGNSLRHKWGLNDKFVVGYSGNLGRAHDIETILQASEPLKDHPHIIFLTIGGGHRYDELRKAVGVHGLDAHHRFLPYQDPQTLPLSLSVPDVHWISLRPELTGLIVPSKFYGIAAAGRPILALTNEDCEIATLINEFQCGHVVKQGDGASLAATILALSKDPALVARMGARARKMLEDNFTRQHALTRWHQVLQDVRTAQ